MSTSPLKLYELPEFEVVDVKPETDHTTLVAVPTAKKFPCPSCGKVDSQKNGRYDRSCLDLPFNNQKIVIQIEANKFRCCNIDCKQTVYVPRFPSIDFEKKMTVRLRENIKREAMEQLTFKTVAERYMVDEKTVRKLFHEKLKELDERVSYAPASHIGIDEAHLSKVMRGVIIDTSIDPARLVDLLYDNKKETIIDALRRFECPDQIKTVTIDMSSTYRAAIELALPGAKIIVDRFHVIQLLITRMEECRKESNKALKQAEGAEGTDGHKPPLNHYWLKKNPENLPTRSRQKLADILQDDPILADIYILKEEFRYIYCAKTRMEAEALYEKWKQKIPKTPVFAPYHKFIKTVENWRQYIFNYFDDFEGRRFSNGPVESINGVIKVVMRNGRGYDFDSLRGKLLYNAKQLTLTNRGPNTANTGSYVNACVLYCTHGKDAMSVFAYNDFGRVIDEVELRAPELYERIWMDSISKLDDRLHNESGFVDSILAIASAMDAEYNKEAKEYIYYREEGIDVDKLEKVFPLCLEIAKFDARYL